MGTKFTTPDAPKGLPQSPLAGWIGKEESRNFRPSVKLVQEVLGKYADVSMLVALDITDAQKKIGDDPAAIANFLELVLKDRVAKRSHKNQ